ncbi:NPC intracellular cholesterol transporter 2-like [Tetranychus urticae]|uniref:MD-2-related lipid-recognition domain-containing protein n=1 Tax=Tetranychus urticae TaxID=32264 RepID=T1KZE9_TETUR|nr:NPC intracellular cholesterol transporter 2-like [Tetranychus urticae]
MIRTIAILALFVACAQARNVSLNNCSTAPTGKINWITIDPCHAEPCTFQSGGLVTVEGELVSATGSDDPKLLVQTELLGVMVPYPGLSSDACKYLTCPLKANVITPFKISLDTTNWLPAGDTFIEFQLKGSDGSQYNCAWTHIEIRK